MNFTIFEATSERIIPLKKRADLVVSEQVFRNETYWLIKDPLEMEFYRLNEEEFFLLHAIDGRSSFDHIKQRFEQKFPAQRITTRELQSFILDLHQKSLLQYLEGNVGRMLTDRRREKFGRKLRKNLSSVLAVKWRGVDPDRLLNRLTPLVGWIFSVPAMVAAAIYISAACLWLLSHYTEFIARLPALDVFLSRGNWLALTATVIGTKIAHELAHGVAFKRYGGECHEIGVMFMFFVPTLYCSTTDSWLLKNKWQRVVIALAGMYIEGLIAATAVFVWWGSEPGVLNAVCLNIMATCTVSVIAFNLNPFLKLDGYYAFSDILELPNLQERSGKVTQSWFLRVALGVEEDSEPHSRFATKLTLFAFRLIAFAVRVLFVAGIFWFLVDRFQPMGLEYFGVALGLVSATSLLLPPLWGLVTFFSVPGRGSRVNMKRALLTACLTVSFVAAFLMLPLPHRIACSFTIEPHDAVPLYVEHSAVLKEVLVQPQQALRAGDPVARLENLKVTLECVRLEAESGELQAELSHLERTRDVKSRPAARLVELRNLLQTKTERLGELRRILESFDVRAPRDGFAIPVWAAPQPETKQHLVSWHGSSLAPENVGTTLPAGQKLCEVGDLRRWDAILAVNEYDVQYVREGQAATLMLDAQAGRREKGAVVLMARRDSEGLSPSLLSTHGGSIEPRTSAADERRPQNDPSDSHFEARVPLIETTVPLSSGLRGQATIEAGRHTLFEKLLLMWHRSFGKKL